MHCMKTELKIFVAGSKELKTQRMLVRNVASNLVTDYERKGKNVGVTVWSFENFSLTFDRNGQQSNYNEFIAKEADLVIFVFDAHVGGVTREEFDVAYESYSRRKHPQICVFSKKDKGKNTDIIRLRQEISRLNQYYTEYDSDDDLERLVEFLLRDCIDSRMNKTYRKSIVGFVILVILSAIIGLLVRMAPLKDNVSEPEVPESVQIPEPVQIPDKEQVMEIQSMPNEVSAVPSPIPVQQDDPIAKEITLQDKADAGDPASCYQLAVAYQNGTSGMTRDLTNAFIYMKKAADAGYIKAYRPLGEMYHGGRGVAKDRDEAAKWYRMAADNGDARALRLLNNM